MSNTDTPHRQNHPFTNEEELVLKSLAAGLKAREVEDMLLDPEDASVAVYIQSACSNTPPNPATHEI